MFPTYDVKASRERRNEHRSTGMDRERGGMECGPMVSVNMVWWQEKEEEIPYKEGNLKDIGVHVGYTILY
jgi:hypothetical protein